MVQDIELKSRDIDDGDIDLILIPDFRHQFRHGIVRVGEGDDHQIISASEGLVDGEHILNEIGEFYWSAEGPGNIIPDIYFPTIGLA